MNSPEKIFGDLFVAFHMNAVHEDGKVITDAIPQAEPSVILEEYTKKQYAADKEGIKFDYKAFFNQWFQLAKTSSTDFESDTSQPVEKHVERLWDVLYRDSDEAIEGSSLIPLPHPYIVPGGRFNEIYYWDSYFTMLGLQESGKVEIIESMIDNFAYLINSLGFIPNGNRTYFTGRSQPPFFACMVELLAEEKGNEVYEKYLPALLQEYQFWMRGAADIDARTRSFEHCVLTEEGTVINRYYDRHQVPRAEMYGADIEEWKTTDREQEEFFLDVRAACESGWDFSSRWLDSDAELSSIHCADILPVDLNCLLYNLEKVIARAYRINGNRFAKIEFDRKARSRKAFIMKDFWNEEIGFFCDYNFVKEDLLSLKSLAGIFPLYFKVATTGQAESCAKIIEQEFLKPGGVVTTNITSGQQWDAPNGWAPLQWITIEGLRNYGHDELAERIKNNWVNLNKKVFKETGKLLEKYNVEDTSLLSGGGEYPVQDGFGWTNGVLLKLLSE